MKEIPLTQGKVVIVDDDMYEYLNQWKWHAQGDKWGKWYARRKEGPMFFQKTIMMHRQIMNASPGIEIDHKNGDGLDNRRENLRIATTAENQYNAKLRKDSTTGFKGVSLSRGKYRARIKVRGKDIYLGDFATPEQAADAYDKAARLYHGPFAQTNSEQKG